MDSRAARKSATKSPHGWKKWNRKVQPIARSTTARLFDTSIVMPREPITHPRRCYNTVCLGSCQEESTPCMPYGTSQCLGFLLNILGSFLPLPASKPTVSGSCLSTILVPMAPIAQTPETLTRNSCSQKRYFSINKRSLQCMAD